MYSLEIVFQEKTTTPKIQVLINILNLLISKYNLKSQNIIISSQPQIHSNQLCYNLTII